MADNYLENKMEELRSGKPKSRSTRKSSGPLRGQRALVAGTDIEKVTPVVHDLIRKGCRVAFFLILPQEDLENGNRLGMEFARNSGSRFYPNGDLSEEFLDTTLSRLIHDWKGIELFVTVGFDSPLVGPAFDKAVASLPYPSDHGSRILKIE